MSKNINADDIILKVFRAAVRRFLSMLKYRLNRQVALVGDMEVGKTSLMLQYVENRFCEEYLMTQGVNFMEKPIVLRNTEITFSIWDLAGRRDCINMLPIVCDGAFAVFFMFDLTRMSTLKSIKEWYRQVCLLNKKAYPVLIGTKYDLFVELPPEEQVEIDALARKFAKAMSAPLIFSSTCQVINIQKIFKVALSQVCGLKCCFDEITNVGDPLLLFSSSSCGEVKTSA